MIDYCSDNLLEFWFKGLNLQNLSKNLNKNLNRRLMSIQFGTLMHNTAHILFKEEEYTVIPLYRNYNTNYKR